MNITLDPDPNILHLDPGLCYHKFTTLENKTKPIPVLVFNYAYFFREKRDEVYRDPRHFRVWEFRHELLRAAVHQLHEREAPHVLQSLRLQNRDVAVAYNTNKSITFVIMFFNHYVVKIGLSELLSNQKTSCYSMTTYATSSKKGCRSCLQTKNILIIFFETVLLGKIKCRISQ